MNDIKTISSGWISCMAAQQVAFPCRQGFKRTRRGPGTSASFPLAQGLSCCVIGNRATAMLGKLSSEEPIAEVMADSLPSPSGAGIGAETPSQSTTTKRPIGRPRKKEKEKRPRGRPGRPRKNQVAPDEAEACSLGNGFKAISFNIWRT